MVRRAFTLVELLVVISVIGLLLGVLVPVVGGVGTASKRVQGQTNLRTMHAAATAWATEHDGRFPPGLLTGSDADSTTGDVRAWDWWTRSGSDSFARPGLLWEYTANPDRVLQCPAYVGTDNWSDGPLPTGYNYNVAFIAAMSSPFGVDGAGAWDLLTPKASLRDTGSGETPTQLTRTQCRRAGTTALFGEGGYLHGANKYMRSPVQDMELCYGGAQAYRHGDCTNVAYVDGHVGTDRAPRRGRHFDALPPHLTALLDHPANGFLSEGDEAYDPR
ncbi:MAG: prepilin-type N-terminal cleavage/methylation domain-containing protein [Planctomycetota bacterium]|nr:prepilin-type N-terminal cleavage/methylation domain-containing protein [Planctomycetota bacterium]